LRIAFIGIRGVPANYSGFETCAEELGARLADRGHQVTVYCRPHHVAYRGSRYRGMELVYLPTIRTKHLETIVHTALSLLHALPRRYDVVLMFIVGNSILAWLPRLVGSAVVLNVDGLDWKRRKWNTLAKRYILFSERLALWFPTVAVTDSRSVQRYYVDRYGTEPVLIAYGARAEPLPAGKYLARFGLESKKYVLFVGRLVPENCVHHLVNAFSELDTDMKCVIVGDAPYAEEYIRGLKATDDPRIVFTGYLFGEGYRELSSHSYVFVETSEVGGTHPALLEAMAYGACVVVNDTDENLETISDAGLSYHGVDGASDLQERLRQLLSRPELVETYGKRARARVKEVYDWDRITDQYERLFRRLVDR